MSTVYVKHYIHTYGRTEKLEAQACLRLVSRQLAAAREIAKLEALHSDYVMVITNSNTKSLLKRNHSVISKARFFFNGRLFSVFC